MKRLQYIFALLGMAAIVACEPNADILDQIDEEQREKLAEDNYKSDFEKAPASYILTDADYALSSNEDVRKYKNFSSRVPAGEYLPEILGKKFVAEDKFEMEVYYNYYQGVHAVDTVELSEDNYKAMGRDYPNFGSKDAGEYAVSIYVNELFKYQQNKKGDEHAVEFTVRKSKMNRYLELKDNGEVVVLDYERDDAYELTNADYETLGYGQYHNFSYIDQAVASIPELGMGPGYYKCFVYNNYFDYYPVYRYDGTTFNPATSVVETSTVFSFSWNAEDYEASFWWKDPNVYITMGVADFQLIVDYVGKQYGDAYLPYSDSETYYGATAHYVNFDKRNWDKSFENWEEAVVTALKLAYLPQVAPDAVVEKFGQPVQYVIEFDTYDGSSHQSCQIVFRVKKAGPAPEFEYVDGSFITL